MGTILTPLRGPGTSPSPRGSCDPLSGFDGPDDLRGDASPSARSPTVRLQPDPAAIPRIVREQSEPFEETRNRGRRTRPLLIRPGNGRPRQAASSRRVWERVVGKVLREVLGRRPGESGQSHVCTAHLVVSLNAP